MHLDISTTGLTKEMLMEFGTAIDFKEFSSGSSAEPLPEQNCLD